MKKNKKGFTLIELLAVVLIMAFIILVAFPSVIRLMKQNTDKKYDIYYDLVKEAALAYSSSRADELGGTVGSGCVEFTLDDLVKGGYIKEFEDNDVTCSTPIGNKIRITNNKGKKSINTSLECKKVGKTTPIYSKKVTNSGTCVAYNPPIQDVLVTALATNLSGNLTTADSNNDRFVTGANPNNYVYYSGKLWRVVSINTVSKTVKLISDEVISIVTYGASSTSYLDSNIYNWINNDFLRSLKLPEQYLENVDWNYTAVSAVNSTLPGTASVQRSRVGLLNAYEYSKVLNGGTTSYLSINRNWWLLSPHTTTTNAWVINNTNAATSANKNTFYGVRPVVTLKANMSFMGPDTGKGTSTNPFMLVGDEGAVSAGTMLNTRFSGEYVKFNGKDYRIVEVSKDYTKIVLNSIVGNQVFDDAYCQLTPQQMLGKYLNDIASTASGAVYKGFTSAEKLMVISDKWCVEPMTTTVGRQSSVCKNTGFVRQSGDYKVGLLKIGEMYASMPAAIQAGEFWTISPVDDGNNCNAVGNRNINYIKADGTIAQKDYRDESGVRPALYLDSNVKITSGTGLSNSPFVIGQ